MTEALLALARRCQPELEAAPLRVEPLAGGGNNRLYRIDAPDGSCVLKHYFRHPGQSRDRLGSEYAFLSRAWEAGVRCVPRPLGKDEGQGMGLYGFVPGRRPAAGEVGRFEVLQALEFLEAVNRPAPSAVPPLGQAAEACFSVPEHVQVVDRRMARLLAMEVHEDVDAQAARFVREKLQPAYREVRARALARAGSGAAPWAGPLAVADRVISPSDFGFHNALRGEGGRLAFLDFEYAGWDDPAKLVCDFFYQPAVPAPGPCFDEFTRGVAALVQDGAGTLARVELLRPLLGLKWCCIVLNHFSAIDLARRTFASAGAADAKAEQLEKARRLLDGILARGEG